MSVFHSKHWCCFDSGLYESIIWLYPSVFDCKPGIGFFFYGVDRFNDMCRLVMNVAKAKALCIGNVALSIYAVMSGGYYIISNITELFVFCFVVLGNGHSVIAPHCMIAVNCWRPSISLCQSRVV